MGSKWFRWAEKFQHRSTRRHSGRWWEMGSLGTAVKLRLAAKLQPPVIWVRGDWCVHVIPRTQKLWRAPVPEKTGPLREPKEWTYFVNNDSQRTFFLFLVDGRERDVYADVRERPCESVLSFHHAVSGDPTGVVEMAPSTLNYRTISLPTNETLDPKVKGE